MCVVQDILPEFGPQKQRGVPARSVAGSSGRVAGPDLGGGQVAVSPLTRRPLAA